MTGKKRREEGQSTAEEMSGWSARRYLAFERDRTRPAHDLIARIPTIAVPRAVDLGCGPGNSTALLRAAFPEATITGIDSSADMLAHARTRLPGIAFEEADIAAWPDAGPFDVILSNAALQWVPDHAVLFPALFARLAPGGTLAVQMPDNLDEPTHRLMREVAASGPWAATLAEAGASRTQHHDAAWYFARLHALGAATDIWRTTYFHVLAGGASAIVEWVTATGLRPYLAPLDADGRADFLARYTDAIAQAYVPQADGTVLLAFPRLFIVATRPG